MTARDYYSTELDKAVAANRSLGEDAAETVCAVTAERDRLAAGLTRERTHKRILDGLLTDSATARATVEADRDALRAKLADEVHKRECVKTKRDKYRASYQQAVADGNEARASVRKLEERVKELTMTMAEREAELIDERDRALREISYLCGWRRDPP